MERSASLPGQLERRLMSLVGGGGLLVPSLVIAKTFTCGEPGWDLGGKRPINWFNEIGI